MTIHKVKSPTKTVNSDIFYNQTNCSLFVENGDWFVSGEINAKEAQELLDAHNPPAPIEPTIDEKLASVGLSINDLKLALGL